MAHTRNIFSLDLLHISLTINKVQSVKGTAAASIPLSSYIGYWKLPLDEPMTIEQHLTVWCTNGHRYKDLTLSIDHPA